jgi:hypothetical protein
VKIAFAHLCDFAFRGENGKLGVIGIFERLAGQEFPLRHPMAYLAIGIEVDSAEIGGVIKLDVKVRNADGGTLIRFGVTFESSGQAPPGTRIVAKHIVPIQNMAFQKPGRYEFAFFLNDHHDSAIPLDVEKLPAGPG